MTNEVQSLDIIIPVCNEEAMLPGTLDSLAAARRHLQTTHPDVTTRLIVCDGNSFDKTPELIKTAGAQLVSAKRVGRGHQLADAVAAGNGQWILMLHADARLYETALTNLFKTLTEQPQIEWGILGHRYDTSSLLIHWTHFANRIRFSCLGIAFGDQSIFVNRDLLNDVGGIPRICLMEDVELSVRLRRRARRISLGAQQTISARRFERSGWAYMLKVTALTTWWLSARLLGVAPKPLAERVYHRYYGKSPS